MTISATIPGTSPLGGEVDDAPASAVSWAAIFAGAVVAAATALILITLGTGLGFAALPGPSSHHRSVTAFAVTSAIWLIVTQWVTAAVGGYVTGRLRTRWANVHTHEVFFRDTAHGLITWALGTMLGAFLAVGALGSAMGAGMRGGAALASSTPDQSLRYSIDALVRPASGESASSGAEAGSSSSAGADEGSYDQIARVLLHGLAQPEVPAADRDYLAHWVARHAGIPQADARQRVDDTISELRQAADKARKAAAATAIFTALSLLIGAFIACVAAALGGRLRDTHSLS